MAMLAFQQALCELIASPALCREVREDATAFLGRFDLSPREQQRLREVVWQRGMSTTCSLYRSNRVTPLYTLLHSTCMVLGRDLHRMLDAYWASSELRDLEFRHEIDHFAHFLKQRLAAGEIASPFVREILEFEVAVNHLRFAPKRTQRDGPLVRVVRFHHDPALLLTSLARGVVPVVLPLAEHAVVLRTDGEQLRVEVVGHSDGGARPCSRHPDEDFASNCVELSPWTSTPHAH
jgi:hypothetical protein